MTGSPNEAVSDATPFPETDPHGKALTIRQRKVLQVIRESIA
jgi:hypothetical protein